MWTCHKCGKPVYFAERQQSLGYDWHPECLRCEECQKRLNPGQHAEHKGVPYCNVPCYSVLFGPTLFGHGSQVEAHKSFGDIEKRLPPGVDRILLESKLKAYNHYYEGNSCQLAWKERNGKFILEGVLHIYWGVNRLIHLRENEDQRHHVQARKRNSYREATDGSHLAEQNFGSEEFGASSSSKKYSTLPSRMRKSPKPEISEKVEVSVLPVELKSDGVVALDGASHPSLVVEATAENEAPGTAQNVGDSDAAAPDQSAACAVGDDARGESSNKAADGDCNGSSALFLLPPKENGSLTDDDDDGKPVARHKREKIDLSHVQIRKMTSSRSKTKLKRRCSINGHFYNRDTKTFKPPYGSASNVWVTSMVTTHDVINLLLDKFCVENSPDDFALYIVRDNGEVRRFKDNEYPLLVRVLLGPHEEVAKVFIMDRKKTDEISSEVAQYLNFQEPELAAILRKFNEEENREVKKIRLKYNEMQRIMRARLSVLHPSQQAPSSSSAGS